MYNQLKHDEDKCNEEVFKNLIIENILKTKKYL